MTYHHRQPLGAFERRDAGEPIAITPEIKKLFEDLQTGFNTFKEKNDERLTQIEKTGKADIITTEAVDKINKHVETLQKRLDEVTLQTKRPILTDLNGEKREMTQDEVEHKAAFREWFCSGNSETKLKEIEKKSLTAGSNPDGGYLVPTQMETTITRVVTEVSPVRSVASVMTIGTNEYKKPINMGGATAGWVSETGTRSESTSPSLKELAFPVHEMYAMPGATQTLLDDANINIEQWLADEVRLTFAQEEGEAFVVGDGVGKPQGFMSYTKVANASYAWGSVGAILTGTANAFSADPDAVDDFLDLVYALKPAYRANARFAMNRATVGAVRKFRDGNDNYVWQPSAQAGQPSTLLGYPVTEMEDMADVGDGAYPVAFADFRSAYLIVDRIGIRVLRDPYSSKPYVLFYTTKRVGGGIQNFEAIKLLKSDDS